MVYIKAACLTVQASGLHKIQSVHQVCCMATTKRVLQLAGITEHGGHLVYKANVKEIITEGADGADSSSSDLRATGVRLADGRVFRGKVVISNATRWDTFEGLVGEQKMPESEKLFR